MIFKKIPVSQLIARRITPIPDILRESVNHCGILTHLTVKEVENGYEILNGTRRYLLALANNITEVPCGILAEGLTREVSNGFSVVCEDCQVPVQIVQFPDTGIDKVDFLCPECGKKGFLV